MENVERDGRADDPYDDLLCGHATFFMDSTRIFGGSVVPIIAQIGFTVLVVAQMPAAPIGAHLVGDGVDLFQGPIVFVVKTSLFFPMLRDLLTMDVKRLSG